MNNIKVFLVAIIALILGFAGGYLIFGDQNQTNVKSGSLSEPRDSASNGSNEEWICSMHPQVRQDEPGLCPVCEMDLIPASSNTSDDPLVLEMTEAAVELANIQTTIIGSEVSNKSEKTIALSGKVQADERLASSQVVHVPGRIEKLYVTFTGEQVSMGQKLADLYSPELITAQRELMEAIKLQSVNPGLAEAARNKLKYWKIPEETIAEIEENGTIQETFPVYAEQSGVVSNRRVSVGDYLKQGEPLFDLTNLKKVWVLFDAYENDLAHIKTGSRIEFTTTTYPNRSFKTRVTFIDPVINPETRVASVRAEVNNFDGLLKPEMFVNGVLKTNSFIGRTAPLTVPKTAVMWTGKRSIVYVKVPDREIPSFQYREIEIGDRLGDSYQILNGLDDGEEVVTNGSFTIDAAAQLNNQASMMNKDVRIKKENLGRLPDFKPDTPESFKIQIKSLVERYIRLKDALVATDANLAVVAASSFIEQLASIDPNVFEGDAQVFWMEQRNAMQQHGKKISELSDVEEQRKQFGFLSDALIISLEAFGHAGAPFFVQHCPMAFNNLGGDWIAAEEEVLNPYFGDKMLKCGFVKRALE